MISTAAEQTGFVVYIDEECFGFAALLRIVLTYEGSTCDLKVLPDVIVCDALYELYMFEVMNTSERQINMFCSSYNFNHEFVTAKRTSCFLLVIKIFYHFLLNVGAKIHFININILRNSFTH